jgi:hypothetical protein
MTEQPVFSAFFFLAQRAPAFFLSTANNFQQFSPSLMEKNIAP